MENVIKRGYLECFVRGVAPTTLQWQRRYYVLYGPKETHKGRLDYYDNEQAYKTEPKVRRTIYLEEVREAAVDTEGDKKHSFLLYMCRNASYSYRFAATCKASLNDWLTAIGMAQKEDQCSSQPALNLNPNRVLVDENAIYESVEDIQQYLVEVHETEAAKRCQLKTHAPYDLFVMSEFLCLVEKTRRVITWNYKHIRRYGCGENNFTFEAGRKSLSGEGLFSFIVDRGSELFRNVQDRMKHMQLKQKDEFTKLVFGGASCTTMPPKTYSSNEPGRKLDEVCYTLPVPVVSRPVPPLRQSSIGLDTSPMSPLSQKPKVPRKVPGRCKPKPQLDTNPAEGHAAGQQVLKDMHDFRSELSSQLAVRKEKTQEHSFRPFPHAWNVTEPHGDNASNRISKGENYELAKSTLPMSAQRKLLPGEYCDTVEDRVLDARYTRFLQAPGKPCPPVVSEEEHTYATYDICGSSRFQGKKIADGSQGSLYSEPVMPSGVGWSSPKNVSVNLAQPIYDTPAEADISHQPTKISEVIGKLQRKISPSNISSEYDHIEMLNAPNQPVPSEDYYDCVINRPR